MIWVNSYRGYVGVIWAIIVTSAATTVVGELLNGSICRRCLILVFKCLNPSSILQMNLRCRRWGVLRLQVIYCWDQLFVTRPGIHGWRGWWRSRAEEPAWWRSWWRPCLVEELMEALPGGGCLSLGRWSPTLKWSSHSVPLTVEYCYHKLPAFVNIPDNYVCFTTH